jgi:glycosyltransferase involved in cell wall biosynthesis
MKTIGIKYIGPILDNSGYSKASRNDILALLTQNIPITVQPVSFETSNPDLGDTGSILQKLINKDIPYNVVMVRTTPEFWGKFMEPGKLMVNHTIWETTKLHPDWVPYINNGADKVLVATQWNADVFKDSGVTIPIGVVPHCLDTNFDYTSVPKFTINGLQDTCFKFGFVGQWTERKDIASLLKAYFYAFQNNEDVALILKTYRSNYSEQEKQIVRSNIRQIKNSLVFDTFPKIYYLPNMLTEKEVDSLYKTMDCYVSLDRAEGWGLGPFQAGMTGKPVIATGFGGVTAFLKEENSYLVNYTLEPTHDMPYSPWYKSEQLWAQADIKHGADLMREVFNNQNEARKKGLKLQKYICDSFSYEVVGKQMVKEIEDML